MRKPNYVTEVDIEKLNELAMTAMREATERVIQGTTDTSQNYSKPEPIDPEVMRVAQFLHDLNSFCDEDHWDNYYCDGAEDHIEQAETLIRAGVMVPKE